jgi:cardiolipin synthase
VYNLPNLLTLSRIAVIPLIFLSVYVNCCYVNYFVGVLFIAASITDYFDGKLARDRGQVSAFGRLFDPIADKLLVASALVVFLAKPNAIHSISYIPVFIILCRELLVSGLREFLREVNVGLPVTRLAKWKTGFQMTALSMLFFKGWFYWAEIGEFLLWIAGILTFITGYQYFEQSLNYIRKENASNASSKKGSNKK